MKRFFLRILPFILVLAPGIVHAQGTLGIAAVVNDKAISVYDLNMRLSLMMVFSGVANTVENRQRLAPQVLTTLIDEELKRQEAARLGITALDAEIEGHISHLENINGLDAGQMEEMLARNKIDPAVLRNQIVADIEWSKLVGLRLSRRFQISDEEIDGYIAEIEKNKGKPEYLVSEIFLPVDQPEKETETRALASKLLQQVKAGAGFPAIAGNFSKSPTAARGGDLGWVQLGQLVRSVGRVLVGLKPGQISNPIRSADGYYIIFLRDQRTARGLETEEAASVVVNLQQFFVPIEPGAGPADVAAVMSAAKKVGDKAKSCEDLDRAAKEVETPLSGNLGDVKIDVLGPQQRSLVRGLPPLTASQPLRVPDGVIVLMVCRRDEPEKARLSLESRREMIAERLITERLASAARQHLRDLRRAAFVDIRL